MTTTGTITSAGVGSGLDVTGIVSKLMAVEGRPVVLLQTQEAAIQTTLTAYGTLSGALSQFQTAVQGLTDITKFQNVNASVADATVAQTTASSTATAGTYALEVTQLAQAQKLVTAGQNSSTAPIGNGTISLDFGTISGGTLGANGTYTGAGYTSGGSGVKTITIDSSNNSLTGIRDAINKANAGVTATIVNDGSNTPYRLSLSMNNMGAANSLKISTSGDAALGTLLNQDPAGTQNLTETITAKNANFKVDGVAITKTSNSVSDVISGVTLNLLKTNAGTPTNVTVAQSSSAAVAAVNSFVTAYNAINKTFSDATAYNATTKQSASLNGENSVLTIQTQIRNALLSPIVGAPSTASKLEQIGVTFQRDGSLSVDSSKLQSAIAANPQGIGGLFTTQGTTTDSLLSYTSASSLLTKPGTYKVNISQLATQASTTGFAAPTTTTITAGVNDGLQIQLDGAASNITVAAGTYTSTSLAAAIQSAINSNATFSAAGSTATVSQNAGIISITSNKYGSASSATIAGGNGESNINGGGAATVAAGLDVVGTINGVAGVGTGQSLAGATSDGSSGLQIKVIGGALGDRGTVSYTQGYANQLNSLLSTVLGSTGQIASRTKELSANTAAIEKSIAEKNIQLASIQANYQAEFTALDVTISQLNGTSQFLTQQLAALSR